MKKTLTLIALMLVLTMALGMLTACGGSTPAVSDQPNGSGSQPVESQPAEPSAPAAEAVDRGEYGIPAQYTKVKIFTGSYGFGEAEVVAAMNEDESAFYLTFICFDETQIVEGTISNGIAMVSYDKSGFMSADAQLICDDALASAEPWAPLQ